MLRTIINEEKRDTAIFIDGLRFVRCHFVDCQLIYEARDDVDFVDCIFERCQWTFDDAAVRMLGFLATVNEKVTPHGQALVDGIFESIRNQKVAKLRAEIQPEITGDAFATEPALAR